MVEALLRLAATPDPASSVKPCSFSACATLPLTSASQLCLASSAFAAPRSTWKVNSEVLPLCRDKLAVNPTCPVTSDAQLFSLELRPFSSLAIGCETLLTAVDAST